MPLTRYQARTEYSLANPELYRAASKDDPDGILEGVATAGLVGILRQLGDLAEFSAGIFHDLHEEVMSTAARGHGLMLRVQQLEAEVPSVEKAFLSQTSHSSLLFNAGVGWHPNLKTDQNMITRGDLPQCIMDSYEECRGPPRLFLLDKFDVAGTGACLKRYSDPSFFKEKFTSTEMMGAGVQKEKRTRKVKKVSRLRNRENQEEFPMSHAKLHQLLSEARNSENNVLVDHVKLKQRQLNGFPLKSPTGESYMERFLEAHSPESKESSENLLVVPDPYMDSSNTNELGLEIREIGTGSPNKLLQRERSVGSSAGGEKSMLEQSVHDLHDDIIKKSTTEKLPESNCNIKVEKVSPHLYKMEDLMELLVDVESNKEYQSDDITSEVENYMDALATMESEMETDSEMRPKNKRGFFNTKSLGTNSSTDDEHEKHEALFSESPSVGDSSESDDENKLFRIGSSNPSDMGTLSNPAVKGPPAGEAGGKVASSFRVCTAEVVDLSSEKPSTNGSTMVSESLEYIVPAGPNMISAPPIYGSELVEASRDSCVADSTSSPGAKAPFVSTGVDIENSEYSTSALDIQKMSLPAEQDISDIMQLNSYGSVGESAAAPEFASTYSATDSPKPAFMMEYHLQMDNLTGAVHAETDGGSIMYERGSLNCIKLEEGSLLSNRDCGDSVSKVHLPLDDVKTGTFHEEAGGTLVCEHLIGSTDRNRTKLEDKYPSSNGNVSDREYVIQSELDNLASGAARSDDADTGYCRNLINSPSRIHIKLQEECLGDVNQEDCNAKTIQACNLELILGEDAQKGRDQLPASSPDLNVEVYSESHVPSSSELPFDNHDAMPYGHGQDSLHIKDDTGAPTSSIEKFSHQNQPSNGNELSVPSEKSLVSEVGPLLSNLLNEQTASLKVRVQNGCPNVPSEASWVEKIDPVENRGLDGSSGAPHLSSFVHLKQPLEPTIDSSASIFPSSGMLSGQPAIEQPLKLQSSGSAVDLPLQPSNAAQANMGAPLLPPLPPNGKKVGKLVRSLPTSEGEMVQRNLKPFLPEGSTPSGDIVEPPHPFLPLNSPEYVKNQYGAKVSGDVVHSSPSTILPIPTIKDDKNERDLITLREEKAKSSLNSFATPPGIKEIQPVSDASQGEQPAVVKDEELLNAFAPSTIKDEQPLDAFVTTTLEDQEPRNAFAPTIGYKEPSLSSTLERGIPSNVSTSLPAAEVGVPNGKPPKLPRPKDPLIEAVASHDRSMLRKVTQQHRPQIVQKADERDSLLEQIRTKSFNLKPTARPTMLTTRSIIQGPRTNLKVAAILEKANAIRQATAGSDEEDDDDSWSDS